MGWTHVTDCVQEHPSKWKQEGSWGFVLRVSCPFEFKPWKDKLNLFNVPKDVLSAPEHKERAVP